MSTWKRWAARAAMGGILLFAGYTILAAQQTTPPESGKSLAERIGLTGDAASKLEPQLDEVADALTRQLRGHQEVQKARADARTALAEVVPTLTIEQRQALGRIMAEGRAGFGPGARSGMGSGRWMGPGMRSGMGSGMGHSMGYGSGMGPGMRAGMGPRMGYGSGMGPSMRSGMGYGMGAGMNSACPFYQGPGATGPGATPGAGSGGPAGPGGR